MHDPIRYYQDFRTDIVDDTLVRTELKSWVCAGGWFAKKVHKTHAAAKRDAEEREAFNVKYPYNPPLGKKTGK